MDGEKEYLTFTGRVQKINRVAIPRTIREALSISEGDYVEIRIRRIMGGKGIKLR